MTILKGETIPVDLSQNSFTDTPARSPHQYSDRVHGGESILPCFMSRELSQLDDAQQDIGTVNESSVKSRRSRRRTRRKLERENKLISRNNQLGDISSVFTFNELFKAGKKCCRGVRWKHSVQTFEMSLFSGTAVRHRAIVNGEYKFSKYVHFLLHERGKVRPIDAPRIPDRQVEKLFTQKVLLPLYLPSMIFNNGASLPYKGFHFSQNMLARDLSRHFRKYGRKGGIILTDGKSFFPNANHDYIRKRHENIIKDKNLKKFADSILATISSGKGMPLGVEPSQAEMIAYPSALDNYLSAQCRLTCGHYMDDFYILVPPDRDPKEIISILNKKAKENKITLNKDKTRYVPLTKPFRFCKTKFFVTSSGKVIRRANKSAVPKDIKKIYSLFNKLFSGSITLPDVWPAINGMLSYLKNYNEHNNLLKLKQKFFFLFGFSCDSYLHFKISEPDYPIPEFGLIEFYEEMFNLNKHGKLPPLSKVTKLPNPIQKGACKNVK